jgi:hypothetical protein
VSDLRAPRNRPVGVRTADTITDSCIYLFYGSTVLLTDRDL